MAVGKSVLLNEVAFRLSSTEVVPAQVNFTCHTKPSRCQNMVESVLEKKRKVVISEGSG